MSAGIDYGLGKTNIDVETGIRYGVIAANDVGLLWFDDSEANYGEPHCPECGGKVTDKVPEGEENYYDEYYCEACKHSWGSEYCYSNEPLSFYKDDEGIKAEQDYDSPYIMIFKSPYYTLAKFCSPCYPGAGDLSSFDKDGVKTYCFGHDWFEDNVAPYPVYRVSDNSKIARGEV